MTITVSYIASPKDGENGVVSVKRLEGVGMPTQTPTGAYLFSGVDKVVKWLVPGGLVMSMEFSDNQIQTL